MCIRRPGLAVLARVAFPLVLLQGREKDVPCTLLDSPLVMKERRGVEPPLLNNRQAVTTRASRPSPARARQVSADLQVREQ